MTKKDLVKIIREVVRKEVKKEVQKIFIKEETSSKLKDIVLSEVSEPKEETHFTKNKALNKVLNETVGFSETEEYPTMGGKAYTTEDMADVLGYGEIIREGKLTIGRVTFEPKA